MIIGHTTQWNFLKKLVEQDRVPHAFLFSGMDGLGKKKTALEFIKLLNCQEAGISKAPCGRCTFCRLVDSQKHPDLQFIEPHGKAITIDQIRELQKWLNLKSQLALQKTVIIDDAHCLNVESGNCFLKTLEEPSGGTIFFLVSSKPELLLFTIRSRCSQLKFFPVQDKEIADCFWEIDPFLKERILAIAWGRPGIALDFLNNSVNFQDFQSWQKTIQQIIEKDLGERMMVIKRFFEQNENFSPIIFLNHFLIFTRQILLAKLGVSPLDKIGDRVELVRQCSFLSIQKMINKAQEAISLILSTNVNPRLVLENLVINI